MRLLTSLFILVLSVGACASTEVPRVAKPEEKKAGPVEPPIPKAPPSPPPIVIVEEPKQLATLDPATLKVTYAKNADPKLVLNQVVRMWAQTAGQLQACQNAYVELEKKK